MTGPRLALATPATLLVAALVAAALVAPVLLFSGFIQSTVDSDIVARNRALREHTAEAAAGLVRERLRQVDADLQTLARRSSDALRRGDAAAIRALLADLQSSRSTLFSADQYVAVGVLSASGAPLAAEPASFSVDPADARTLFDDARDTSTFAVSELSKRRSTEVAAVSRAVRDRGQLLGVAYVLLHGSWFISILETQITPGRELVLLDRQSLLLATAETAEDIGVQMYGGRGAGAPFVLPKLDRALVETGSVTATVGTTERVLTYAPAVPGRWAVYLIESPAVAFAGERTLVEELQLGSRVAVVVAAVLAAAIALLFGVLRRERSALAVSQRELARANVQLAAASRAKSDFLARMSHELRTPLNAIIGFSDVLLERMFGALNDRQDDYLRDIRNSGEHLLGLINEILDLSKIEAGKMELHPEEFELPVALQGLVAMVHPLAEKKRLRLGLEVDPHLRTVTHDQSRFNQVLLNLLSNAVKFTPEGGAVRMTASSGGDGWFEVAVADTGVGIRPEDQDTIFEEFEQVGPKSARQQGTGLGLSVSRSLVELMGGRISLASAPGAGSTFTVRLPLRAP